MPTRSTSSSFLRGVVAVLATLAATAALAQNYRGLLKNTPSSSFTDEDHRLFEAAARKALDESQVGAVVSWENPATGSRGDLKVLKDFTWKQNRCRQISVHNESQGTAATNTADLCKVADKWRAVSASELAKP